ncbi:inactive ubiquitin thioesterase OTULINL isoform X3 [Prionailurus bengalensis]|uniref:inactive ubiquitin thioesterase OTULINL isoform X3 n=1 Tax=Prionailurus bengalensis TaxID=37029 RepID=UPI001CA7DAB8|nr:inactive ubiquitin thioesterase OTULINL isoform X3 [Prionailurus bengalensis]
MGFRCKVPGRSRDPSRWKPQDVSGGAAPGTQERLPRCAHSAGSPKLPTVDPVCARRPRPSPPESPPTSAAASHWRPRASVGPRALPGGSANRGPHPAPLEPASRAGRPRRLTDRRRRLRARPQRAAGMAAPRSPPRVRAREREGPRAPTAGSDQVHSWTLVTSQALDTAWKIARGSVTLAVAFLVAALCYVRRMHSYLGRRLKWWIGYLQRKFKRNLSVEAEVDLLSYSAREWKGETPRAKLMRKAYEELFWRHHIKCVRQVKRDNYDALRSVLFQIFSQGLSFPSWMKEKDIVKWTEFSGIKDYHKRGSMCNILFSDAILEYKLYEALKFIMLYQVTEVYEQMKTQKVIPSLFRLLFSRETSSDPLSFMMNHLNSVGDTCGLEQIDMFILGHSLEIKIKVFRLFKFNSRDFEVCYPDLPFREWPEISLLTENDRHYHIPVF